VKISDASAQTFRGPTYNVSPKGGKSVIVMKETLWENNMDFAKDMPLSYAKFIVIVTIVSEEKNRMHYFLLAPVINP
jgi:hypothetical protein